MKVMKIAEEILKQCKIKIEVLNSTPYVELRKINDVENDIKDYYYLHELRKVISILPFRKVDNQIQFLLRNEITPSWNMDYNISSITGSHDQKTIILTAVKELKEESGYSVLSSDIISLGTCRGIKSCDTIFNLFGIDLTNKKKGNAITDGSKLEKKSFCVWKQDISESVDPLSYVAFYRLKMKNYI